MKILFIIIQVILAAIGFVLLFLWIKVWIKAAKAFFQTATVADYHDQLNGHNVYKRFTLIFLCFLVYIGLWLVFIFLSDRFLV